MDNGKHDIISEFDARLAAAERTVAALDKRTGNQDRGIEAFKAEVRGIVQRECDRWRDEANEWAAEARAPDRVKLLEERIKGAMEDLRHFQAAMRDAAKRKPSVLEEGRVFRAARRFFSRPLWWVANLVHGEHGE